ncbi:hypothetical protein THTE_4087 [Thermogutta terrifontis]|uniref:Uncharacterized protein n=1 Tax=Thermogutta terrifontis TaxID=1331910 RepID=A0A286RL66_9BACT|nr:hypothetical protein THTE_4087 [Thermogutta terrifontis]
MTASAGPGVASTAIGNPLLDTLSRCLHQELIRQPGFQDKRTHLTCGFHGERRQETAQPSDGVHWAAEV